MLTGSKRKIRKMLWEMFYDESCGEYPSISYSRGYIHAEIKKECPESDWSNDIYYVIREWQKKANEKYNEIEYESQVLIQAGVTDTREICIKKYNTFLVLFANEKAVPLYHDKDIGEWRVANSLNIYEEIMGDKVRKHHNLRNKYLGSMAKRGGCLPSGVDTRKAFLDTRNEDKMFEDRSEGD